MKSERFQITGMTCSACSAHVEKATAEVAGVDKVNVSLLMNNMTVEYESPATPQAICAAVEAAGYGAAVAGGEEPAGGGGGIGGGNVLEDRETPKLRRRLIVSLCMCRWERLCGGGTCRKDLHPIHG